MTRPPGASFITGIAAHSLGEAFLDVYFASRPDRGVVGADLRPPSGPPRARTLSTFQFDLNPLTFSAGYAEFGGRLRAALEAALDRVGAQYVECLIQSAGVYDFGRFLDHDVARRTRAFGVNLLGHVEVLHSVMSLNARRGVDNATALSHVDVGSFQGLYARAERPVYAPSKAGGIDFDGSLFEGREVARSVYFAPAAIDTHMLHFNHWVKKAQGSETLFQCAREGDRKEYEAIFLRCDESALGDVAKRCGIDAREAMTTLERYVATRREAFTSSLGVLDVEVCARMLFAVATNAARYPSGVYLAYAPNGTEPRLAFAEFPALSRLGRLEAVGRPMPW